MRDLEGQHNACEEKCKPDDEERIHTEVRHLVDDALNAQTLCDLPRRLSVEEGDAPDVRKMCEDKASHRLEDALHGFPPFVDFVCAPTTASGLPPPS